MTPFLQWWYTSQNILKINSGNNKLTGRHLPGLLFNVKWYSSHPPFKDTVPLLQCSGVAKLCLAKYTDSSQFENQKICIFIVNFEHILLPSSNVSIVNFEHVIAGRPIKLRGGN